MTDTARGALFALTSFAIFASFGCVAKLLIIAACRSAPAVVVALMQVSQLPLEAVYGAIFFSETPDGMAVVLTGLPRPLAKARRAG